jgi:glycosyltransferase involved in cell wall biosynthesis
MKILVISAAFPPRIIGGAELSAYNLALWLSQRGHEVGVLTVAEDLADEAHGEIVDGLSIWRICWPRTHTQHSHRKQSPLRKALWHIQDHFDPRNKPPVARILREFKPDTINVHILQGIGHNVMPELEQAGVPIIYFLHDLGLTCLRQNMYKGGENCQRLCPECKISSAQKMRMISRVEKLHFVSPSAANLQTINTFTSASKFPGYVIPNIDLDKHPALDQRKANSVVHFIYIGKLEKAKGIAFLLNVLDKLAGDNANFEVTVVGGGPLEVELRATYRERHWLKFTGKVAPSEVKNFLGKADLLLLPSLWRENHPGVVRHALRSGIPAFVSDVGGSKEMIRDGESGFVLKTGDDTSWTNALSRVLADREALSRLQEGAKRAGADYSADQLGEKVLALIERARGTAFPPSEFAEKNHENGTMASISVEPSSGR